MGIENSSEGADRLPTAEKLLEAFQTLLNEGAEFVRQANITSPEQHKAILEFANRAREAGEAMDSLHGIIEESDAGEGNLRILRGAQQSYSALNSALDTVRKSFNKSDDDDSGTHES